MDMSFTDFAKEARKLAPQHRIGQVNPGFKPNPESLKKIIDETNYTSFVGNKKNGNANGATMTETEVKQPISHRVTKQTADERHCNIIKNVISESQQEEGQPAGWKSCRHYKRREDRDFCTEFFSLCAKERCGRARR